MLVGEVSRPNSGVLPDGRVRISNGSRVDCIVQVVGAMSCEVKGFQGCGYKR